MKVLFVRSGNHGIDPISQNQGDSLIEEGITVLFFDLIGRGKKGYLLSIIELQKAIKSIKPDIIHAHYSLTGYIAALSKGRIPLVVSLMGSDVNEANNIQRLSIAFFSRFFWKRVIVKSMGMKSNLGNPKAIVIPNGVNLSKFIPIDKTEAIKELNWDKCKIHILFASNPERLEKNYILAKNALELLNNPNIELHFLMNIPHEKMFLTFNAASLLLLTSFYEGSPNVVKEAMACNCPIVTTKVGDVAEIIGASEGCYITSFNVKDVANKISLVLDSQKRTSGRKAIQNIDSKVIANRLIQVYKTIVK